MNGIYDTFGIRRTDPEFWRYADWFNGQNKKNNSLNSGLLEFSRYQNL